MHSSDSIKASSAKTASYMLNQYWRPISQGVKIVWSAEELLVAPARVAANSDEISTHSLNLTSTSKQEALNFAAKTHRRPKKSHPFIYLLSTTLLLYTLKYTLFTGFIYTLQNYRTASSTWLKGLQRPCCCLQSESWMMYSPRPRQLGTITLAVSSCSKPPTTYVKGKEAPAGTGFQ